MLIEGLIKEAHFRRKEEDGIPSRERGHHAGQGGSELLHWKLRGLVLESVMTTPDTLGVSLSEPSYVSTTRTQPLHPWANIA